MIGIVKESSQRVALTPSICDKIGKQLGVPVWIESGAGDSANFNDAAYAGLAEVKSRDFIFQNAEIIITVDPLSKEEMAKIGRDCILISMFEPYNNPTIIEDIKSSNCRAFSLDMIPRSTLAQAVDVLSSMASLAGYQAVLTAAQMHTRCMPMMTTAAGTVKPASALIIGAGVAGLQAIATAKRIGCRVSAFDVRSSSKEEVQSLGAKFVEVEGAADDKGAGGYAVQQTEDYLKRQKEEIHNYAQKSDIIITTAQLRGKKAPLLIEDRTIAAMQPGSVIIDLAESTGGNTSFTKKGTTVTENGVFIVGDSNLADRIAQHSSELLASNYFNFIKLFIKDKAVNIDFTNPILDSSFITK